MTKYRTTASTQTTKESDFKYAVGFGILFIAVIVPMLVVVADRLAK